MKSVEAYPWLKKTANELMMMPVLPNSFIIEGNKGLGKSELAFDLIQKQLCQENTGCNYCQSCLLFKENTHPEFLLVNLDEKKSFISIKQIREVIDFMNLTVSNNSSRMALILNADRLNIESQNALLKTLEENSTKKFIFLVCNSRNALLPTIYSRCFIKRIPTPDTESINNWLNNQGIFDVSANDFPNFYSPKMIKTLVEEGKSNLYNNVLSKLDDLICGNEGAVTTQQFFRDLDINFPEKIDLMVQYVLLKIGVQTSFYKPHTKFNSLRKTDANDIDAASFLNELIEYKSTLLKIPGLNEQIAMSYFLNKMDRVI
jgi:hypothetical protein